MSDDYKPMNDVCDFNDDNKLNKTKRYLINQSRQYHQDNLESERARKYQYWLDNKEKIYSCPISKMSTSGFRKIFRS